jgi:hypothetical protein
VKQKLDVDRLTKHVNHDSLRVRPNRGPKFPRKIVILLIVYVVYVNGLMFF